eukprot:scaffold17183_cov81-Skeletonema_dohrnii-CCMP3373.AAC.2
MGLSRGIVVTRIGKLEQVRALGRESERDGSNSEVYREQVNSIPIAASCYILDQRKTDVDVSNALRAALETDAKQFRDAPLILEVPMLYIVPGYIKLLKLRWTSKTIQPAYPKPKRQRKYVRKRRHRPPLPTVYARASIFMAKKDEEEGESFEATTWDTDGIPFIIDSGANVIISNVRDLFGDLVKVKSVIDTHDGESCRVRYMGTFKLELPDDDGNIWTYQIPDCYYDPQSKHNILGVAALANFFKDQNPSTDPLVRGLGLVVLAQS